MKRLAGVLVLVLAAAFVTGCGSSTSPATVNGTGVDRGEFLDQLSQLAKLNGADANAITNEQSSDLLTQTIIALLIADDIKRLGLTVDEANVEANRVAIEDDLKQRAEAGEATEAISKSFIAYAARVQAQQDVLIARITDTTKPWFTDGDVRSYYDFVKDTKYVNYCTHHILVDAEADATEIVGLLKNGGDFAQLAKDRSTDASSGDQGGDLGCNQKGSFVTEFEDAVLDARTGDTLGPIKTEYGYHVIRVDQALGLQPFDTVRESIATTLGNQDGWLSWKVYSSKIKVNKKYGSWSNDTTSVTPPADPTQK
ncbi:MAG: peptidylprolyl isomerase [Acidimicrobiales bacterium]